MAIRRTIRLSQPGRRIADDRPTGRTGDNGKSAWKSPTKEIVKRFDVVAIQEAQRSLGALRELLVGLRGAERLTSAGRSY
jgi:hypothetical protein